ncbi:MAG: hypothetical protein ACLQU4_10315, partial [Limisphaerales bacterium]
MAKQGEKFELESKYLGGHYVYPGDHSPTNNFSSVEEFSAIVQIPELVYYTRWGRLVDLPLEIPDTLHKLLSIFFILPPEERTKFVRAAYWFAQAQSAYRISKSYEYIALVMAIETLSTMRRTPSFRPRSTENKRDFYGLLSLLFLVVCRSFRVSKPFRK